MFFLTYGPHETDYINIGSTPHDEPCIGVGHEDYYTKGIEEVRRFARQIRHHYPPPVGAVVKVKAFDHDFGRYHEVVVIFALEDEEAQEYAYMVDADPKNVLSKWDSNVE